MDITADVLDSLWSIHHHLLRDLSKPHHMLQEGEEGGGRGRRRESVVAKYILLMTNQFGLTLMLNYCSPLPSSSTHNALVIVSCHGAETYNHPYFPLPIKVVLEKMCHF